MVTSLCLAQTMYVMLNCQLSRFDDRITLFQLNQDAANILLLNWVEKTDKKYTDCLLETAWDITDMVYIDMLW